MSSRRCRPSVTGSASQRAARARSEWPWPKTSDPAVGGPAAGDHPVEPRRHLRGGLAAGHRAAPDRPAGVGLADLRGGLALEVAVVPLGEVVVDLRLGMAGQPRGLAGRAAGARSARARSRRRRAGRAAPAATRLPSSVSGRSVVEVCRPSRLHSVSPCRTSQTSSHCHGPIMAERPRRATMRAHGDDPDAELARRSPAPGSAAAAGASSPRASCSSPSPPGSRRCRTTGATATRPCRCCC